MNRKTFLQQSSIITCGMLSMPSLMTAKDKNEIILYYNKRYHIDTKWGALDFNRYPVKDCHEMVQDKAGRIILLTNEIKNNVIIYDQKEN